MKAKSKGIENRTLERDHALLQVVLKEDNSSLCTWKVISWEERIDEIIKDVPFLFLFHELMLLAKCLHPKLDEKRSDLAVDSILFLYKLHAINPGCTVLKFCSPYLHNLVGLTVEVLGTETREEVCRHCWQKWSEPNLEPLLDEGIIRKLCLTEVVDLHLSDGIKNIRFRQTDVQSLQEKVDAWIYNSNPMLNFCWTATQRYLPCWRTCPGLHPEMLQTFGRNSSKLPCCIPFCWRADMTSLWQDHWRTELQPKNTSKHN